MCMDRERQERPTLDSAELRMSERTRADTQSQSGPVSPLEGWKHFDIYGGR